VNHIAREVQERTRIFSGQNFLARGFFVSTVSRDEKLIRENIRRLEQEGQRLEQLKLATE
jgi:putative transposase